MPQEDTCPPARNLSEQMKRVNSPIPKGAGVKERQILSYIHVALVLWKKSLRYETAINIIVVQLTKRHPAYAVSFTYNVRYISNFHTTVDRSKLNSVLQLNSPYFKIH